MNTDESNVQTDVSVDLRQFIASIKKAFEQIKQTIVTIWRGIKRWWYRLIDRLTRTRSQRRLAWKLQHPPRRRKISKRRLAVYQRKMGLA